MKPNSNTTPVTKKRLLQNGATEGATAFPDHLEDPYFTESKKPRLVETFENFPQNIQAISYDNLDGHLREFTNNFSDYLKALRIHKILNVF